MDGLEACRQIRGSGREDKNIPIFALSANDGEEDIRNIREVGMNGHLSKPFDVDKIYQLLKGIEESRWHGYDWKLSLKCKHINFCLLLNNFRKQKKEDNMKLKTAILQKRSLDRQYEKSTGIILEKMAETAENNADILLRWETPSEK